MKTTSVNIYFFLILINFIKVLNSVDIEIDYDAVNAKVLACGIDKDPITKKIECQIIDKFLLKKIENQNVKYDCYDDNIEIEFELYYMSEEIKPEETDPSQIQPKILKKSLVNGFLTQGIRSPITYKQTKSKICRKIKRLKNYLIF